MSIISVDGNLLRKMIIEGANELTRHRREIDALNVFPVPDGDTGTNMSLTVQAAAKEVEKLSTPNIYDVAKAASGGSLRGARGNSGVILSQLFRGFAKGLEGKAVANADELAHALTKGMETAYKAVMKPKEGTILTIARVIGEQATESSYDSRNIDEIMDDILKHVGQVLAKTTQMLPVLRQAGVVDAGGKGLVLIFEGARRAMDMDGNIALESFGADGEGQQQVNAAAASEQEIKFAYCTEFFINVKSLTDRMEDNLKHFLSSIGDSVVVVGDEEIVKVHVHTNHPGTVLERALEMGSLSSVKIENMKQQHTSLINFSEESKAGNGEQIPDQEEKETGFVAVSMGSGLKELFLNIGADVVIEGGQTMNPSTEDILSAIEKVHARNVIILPNNKNIVLTAEQAGIMTKNKKVWVFPTLSIPQGVSSLINYVPSVDIEENLAVMREGLKNITTGQVTYAVRDTKLGDKEIREGDFICMQNGEISVVQRDLQAGAKALIDEMLTKEGETVTLYYGEDVSREMAEEISGYVTERYPDHEIEIYAGGQPLYYYILSLE